MTKDDKLNKVIQDFSLLPDDKQDYVLAIAQALVFANDDCKAAPESDNQEEEDE